MKNTGALWWKKIVTYFKGYPGWLVEFAVAWSFAFFAGFLIRSLGKYIIFSAIAVGIAVLFLTRFDLATFHVMRIKALLGIEHALNLESLGNTIVNWVKTHTAAFLGAVIGFFFGWSFGR